MAIHEATLFPELQIRPLTRRLVTHLLFDLPLPGSLLVDFGIDSDEHYQALRAALLAAQEDVEVDEEDEAMALVGLRKRIVALDAAYGNGLQLNAFVRKHAPQYAERVHFQTSWDVIYGRVKPEQS